MGGQYLICDFCSVQLITHKLLQLCICIISTFPRGVPNQYSHMHSVVSDLRICNYVQSSTANAPQPTKMRASRLAFCAALSPRAHRVGRHAVRSSASVSVSESKPVVSTSTSRPRVLSGVQPSGALHLGNYLGAVRQWAEQQDTTDNFFAVVDLHAVTVKAAGATLRQQTLEATAMYLACGIDPAKSSIFVQSHVTAHVELCWLLNCITPYGWLQRMIQFKEKARKQGESASVGLFTYPILQAADVLLYNADIVPVGEDQRQHIELARDIARRYNDIYCAKKKVKTFTEPKLQMPDGVARVMALDDGTTKMSKSAESDASRINLTDSPQAILKKIKRCKTDSAEGLEFDNPDRPECNNLLNIYRAATQKTREQVETECSHLRWGQFKPLLADALIELLDPIRSRYEELIADKAYLASVLRQGYENADKEAQRTVGRVKSDMGFLRLQDIAGSS